MTTTGPVGEDIIDLERLHAIGRIDFDNTALRAALDRVATRIKTATGLPASAVTIVLHSAQLFVGSAGLPDWLIEAGGTPVEWSLCANVVTGGRPYLVPDAGTDPRHATNPLVRTDLVGSYAGVPITAGGHIVGAACIIGAGAHTFTDEDLTELQNTVAEIEALLQQYSAELPASV